MNVKQGICLDTRVVFYINTGVMMYMNPTQTSCFPGETRSQCFQPPCSSPPPVVGQGLHCCVCVEVSYTKRLAVYVSQKTYLLSFSDDGDPSLGGNIRDRLSHRGTVMTVLSCIKWCRSEYMQFLLYSLIH